MDGALFCPKDNSCSCTLDLLDFTATLPATKSYREAGLGYGMRRKVAIKGHVENALLRIK